MTKYLCKLWQMGLDYLLYGRNGSSISVLARDGQYVDLDDRLARDLHMSERLGVPEERAKRARYFSRHALTKEE